MRNGIKSALAAVAILAGATAISPEALATTTGYKTITIINSSNYPVWYTLYNQTKDSMGWGCIAPHGTKVTKHTNDIQDMAPGFYVRFEYKTTDHPDCKGGSWADTKYGSKYKVTSSQMQGQTVTAPALVNGYTSRP